MYRSHVLLCGGTGCTSSGGAKIIEALEAEIKAQGLADDVKIVETGCVGLCEAGPVMIVYPEGCVYSKVDVKNIPEIVSEHLLKGRPVSRLLYKEAAEEEIIKSLDQTDFFKKQKRIVMRNCGIIDPENIDEYIVRDGYEALGKCLTEYTP